MRDKCPDNRSYRRSRPDRELQRCRNRQVQDVRAYCGTCAKSARATDQGMLREFRVPLSGWPSHLEVWAIHLEGGEGSRRDFAKIPRDTSLSRRGCIHDLGPLVESAEAIQAGKPIARCGGPPNTRLKLPAPVLNQSGRRPEMRCSRIP